MKTLRNYALLCALPIAVTTPAFAEAPALQTPAPVIYLADNLDEQDNLGWCIDTLGRGFGERLQAHSCKPQGGDVQFSYDAKAQAITSVAYENYCMAHAPNDQSTFALVTCDPSDTAQQFTLDTAANTIHPTESPALCVTVGNASKSAGPFMSRTLALTDCATTEASLKEWVIKN